MSAQTLGQFKLIFHFTGPTDPKLSEAHKKNHQSLTRPYTLHAIISQRWLQVLSGPILPFGVAQPVC